MWLTSTALSCYSKKKVKVIHVQSGGREGLVLHQQVTPPKKRNEGHLAGACASNMPQQLQAMKQIAKITASFLHRGPPDTRSRLLEWSLAHGRLLWSTERLHRSLCQSVFWLDRHNSPFSPPSFAFFIFCSCCGVLATDAGDWHLLAEFIKKKINSLTASLGASISGRCLPHPRPRFLGQQSAYGWIVPYGYLYQLGVPKRRLQL